MNSFYCDENRTYFLEHKKNFKEEIDKEYEEKNKNRINSCNSEETKEKNVISYNELIDQYDEKTVLLQIPQKDSRIEDVVKKFKDPNKVVDTFVILQEERKIIAGQGYMRKLSHYLEKKDSDMNELNLNIWICASYGVKFQTRNPY